MLNQSYEPIKVCTVKKAVILLFLNKAEIIVPKVSFKLHSATNSYDWPSVIRLRKYYSIPFRNIVLNRKNVLKRDKHKCVYCGRGDLQLTIDHVIPRALGGQSTWENLVTACLPCNNKKGDKLLADTNLTLKIKPVKPNHITAIKNIMGRVDSSWEPFLFN